jgi:hypothetical protein
MAKYALLSAAVLATALADPVMAQPVVEEPGYCAQFYPNANCQNYGPGNPYTDGYYPGARQNGYAVVPYHSWNRTRRHHQRKAN